MTTTQTATIIDSSAATELARRDKRNANYAVYAAAEAAHLFLNRTGSQSELLNAALGEANIAAEAAHRAYHEAVNAEFCAATR